MSTTKTVSTRVDDNIYKSLVDYSNQEGQTISQAIHQIVVERLECNQEFLDDSKRSITADDEKTTIATAEFEQDSAMKKLLEELQDKNVQEKNKQVAEMAFGSYIDELKQSIKDLTTSFDKKLEEDRMKKGMECFVNDSCLPTS